MEDKVEEIKEQAADVKEDAGNKLQTMKGATDEKVEAAKEAVEKKLGEVKEKVMPTKRDDSDE